MMIEKSFSEKFEVALQSQREESIQVFLRDHPGILLYTFCNAVGTYICLPKFRFGTEYVSDFVIVQLWSTITRVTLIELEPSNESIFTRDGRFAARLNGAVAQVNDWFAWLRENDQYFCDSLIQAVTEVNSNLAIPISNRIRYKSIQAKIIVGRRSSLSEQDKQRLAAQNLRDRDMEILAYDRLVDVASDMRVEGSERIIRAVSQRIVDSV
jgi:Domain of unknown function (DUF4263)